MNESEDRWRRIEQIFGERKYPHCTRNAYLTEDALRQIKHTQDFMLDLARPRFDEKDSENLRVIVRLVMEFRYFCQLGCAHKWCAEYVSRSIWAGLDFYDELAHTYRGLEGAVESTLDWKNFSATKLKSDSLSLFAEFEREAVFERKMRLLLDLYKLQIVFVAIFFENGMVVRGDECVSACGKNESSES